jgi:hypothetical protein
MDTNRVIDGLGRKLQPQLLCRILVRTLLHFLKNMPDWSVESFHDANGRVRLYGRDDQSDAHGFSVAPEYRCREFSALIDCEHAWRAKMDKYPYAKKGLPDYLCAL